MTRLRRTIATLALASGALTAIPLQLAHAEDAYVGGADLPTEYVAAVDAEARTTTTTTLPTSVDLSAWTVPVKNQGSVQSCVSWAITYAMLGWYSRHDGHAGQPFSPMYTYSQTNGGLNRGTNPGDVLTLLRVQGADTEADYAPGDANYWTQPSAAERANAQQFRISGFRTLFSGQDGFGSSGQTLIKKSLAAGRPVAILMRARTGFRSLGAGSTAVDKDTTGSYSFLHEVLAVGYDANGVLVQNSWGTGWANQGFGRVGWNVIGADVVRADVIKGFGRPHDVTGNGTADVMAIRQDGTLWKFDGRGSGGFNSEQLGTSTGWRFFDSISVSTDLNGDGFNDLLGRSAATGELYFYAGDGAGGFGDAIDVGSAFADLDVLVSPGDWNRDGRADLIGRTPDGLLWLYAGNGRGAFGARTEIGHGWGMFDTILGVGDWNSDGVNDLAARKPDGTLWLYPGSSTGGFHSAVQIGHGWQNMTALVAPGDVTGDDHPDLLARTSDGTLLRYPGNGSAGFYASSTVGSGWNPMVSIG